MENLIPLFYFKLEKKQNYMLVSNCCLGASGTSDFHEAFLEHFSEMCHLARFILKLGVQKIQDMRG